MGLLSGLSNIFHGIGHLLGGTTDDEEKKKKQQQTVMPQATVVNPAQNQIAQVTNAQAPALSDTPLQKVTKSLGGTPTPPQALTKVQPNNPLGPDAPTGNTNWKAVAAEVPLSAAKVGVSTVASIPELYDLLTPGKGSNRATQALQKVGAKVDKKAAAVAATDTSGNAADSYQMLQVPEQAATLIGPGDLVKLAKGGSKVAEAWDAAANSDVASRLRDIPAATKKIANNVAPVVNNVKGFFNDIPVLSKAVQDGAISASDADQATKVAPGVHTVNPSRPTDAAEQLASSQPPEPIPAPAPAPTVPEVVPAPAPVAPAVTAPTIKATKTMQLGKPSVKGNSAAVYGADDPNLQQIMRSSIIAAKGTAKTAAEHEAALTDAGLSAGDIRAIRDHAIANADSNGNVDSANLKAMIEERLNGRAPAPAKVPVVPAEVTKVPAKGKLRVAADAPEARASIGKKLTTLSKQGGDHNVFSNKELLQAGVEHANTFNDADLIDQYKNGFDPHGASDIAKGHGALERLNEIVKSDPENKDAAQAIENIVNGATKELSSGGRTVNYAQEFYDGLKGPAKTSYLIRQIDKIREEAGLPLLRDSEADNLAATKKIDEFVSTEEKNKAAVVELEKRLGEIKDHALPENGGGSKELTSEANDLNKAIKDHQLAQSKNTAELARYYDTVAPRNVALQTKFGDLGRSLMLSSAAGRVNDVLTTGINSAHQLLQQTVEAAAGKLTKKSGTVIDTLPSPKAVARGVAFGLKKTKARFQGNIAGGDASSLLKKAGSTTGKGQLLSSNKGFTGGVRKIVRSATEIATDLSEGIKESRIQQLASQQGKKLGLAGDDLKTYTAAQTAAPTRQMMAAGERLQEEVNNMHDNPISAALGTFSSGLAKVPVVGEQMKNLILPFTRWAGGQLHNALVDKNALVNGGQIVKAVIKGDQQGAITAASKLAVNGVGAIGVGYALAKAGLLTHENAQGYDDDGVYLHVDGRYIPASFLGFFAPGIILGASAHDAMQKNGDGKGNILGTAVDTTKNVVKNSFLAYGGQSLTGQSNAAVQAFQNSKETGYGGVPPVIGGQIASEYIPAILNDVNSGLNNGVGVGPVKTPSFKNPTHEAPLTKVTSKNPATGQDKKNIAKTVGNQLLAKIPVASQALPRNTGVAAPDGFDRIVRGSRDTQAELDTKAAAKSQANTSADLKKRGVPDPTTTYKKGDSFDNAVENRIENKNYDQAIEGLQQKLKIVQGGDNVTEKQTSPIEDKIKQIQVLKKGNYDPSVRDLYTNTDLSEWRDMGDPESDNYEPDTFQLLASYDKDLTASGVSGKSGSKTDPKYSAKDTSKSGASAAKKAITSNTLGSTPSLASLVDISNLSPRKISDTSAKIPTIQQIRAGQLIKKRAISVGKA